MSVKNAYSSLKERDPKAVIELYKGQEITLSILDKGLKRVNASGNQELRNFFMKATINNLKNTETRHEVFKKLLDFCKDDLKRIEMIFTYGKEV